MMSRTPAPIESSAAFTTHRTESFDGTLLAYDLYESDSERVVLVVPGFWRTRGHRAMRALANLLLEHGYRPAVCDLRGHGESGGVFGFNRNEHHDLEAIAADLQQQSGARSFSIVAFSYGAAIAISAAARHSLPLDALVCISAVADFDLITPRFRLLTLHRHIAISQALQRPRFEWRLRRTPKLRAADDVGGVAAPLSLIHFKDDWLIGHQHSLKLFQHATDPKEVHILDLPGEYHADRIFSAAPKVIEPLLLEFLARHTSRTK
ncbi:MAG TPA: alpha/beta fold hydrolase [Thermoanaerobaculia bacterium]|nr:alpha/beta fold hydrolase [Thermoanaerobaculia bacterium]